MIYKQAEHFTVYHGSCLDVMRELPDSSVDSIVTDPPYELGFMGKSWDASGIAYNVEVWRQALRVLKPGGHLLAFSGSRTYHRMTVAIEDAGFEIRDQIMWIYGSGFPKSHDVSKAIDKTAGAEREVVGVRTLPYTAKPTSFNASLENHTNESGYIQVPETAPATAEAQQWHGWGTALKPAHEPIVVARKPLIGTVAANVLAYGTGGLNIDGCRIEGDMSEFYSKTGKPRSGMGHANGYGMGEGYGGENANPANPAGRWPANVLFDEEAAAVLDGQSGVSKSTAAKIETPRQDQDNAVYGNGLGTISPANTHTDTGGASRFFYVAKASKKDRNEGLDELPELLLTGRDPGQDAMQNAYKTRSKITKNFHPTVKPTQLMQYLVRLVTPPNGVVLDPFLGSGSTGKAAMREGFDFIGIELTDDYLPLAVARIESAERPLL